MALPLFGGLMPDLTSSPSSITFHEPFIPLEAIDSLISLVCSYIYDLMWDANVVFGGNTVV